MDFNNWLQAWHYDIWCPSVPSLRNLWLSSSSRFSRMSWKMALRCIFTCKREKKQARVEDRITFFNTLNSFCRQIWETDDTSVTGPGMEPKYVCQVWAGHWGETLLASINWRFAGNPCSSHSFWNNQTQSGGVPERDTNKVTRSLANTKTQFLIGQPLPLNENQ